MTEIERPRYHSRAQFFLPLESVPMFRPLKNVLRRHRLSRSGLAPQVDVQTELHGEESSAWGIATDYLPAKARVYSIGIGRDVAFDLGLIATHGCQIHAFDPTPRCIEWVSQQRFPSAFRFNPIGLAAHDGELHFYPPKKARSAHFTPVQRYRDQDGTTCVTAPVRRLSTLMRERNHSHIDLLKIDIDGGEYDVLGDMITSQIFPDQLLLEFHHMFATIPYAKTETVCQRLLSCGYHVFHISPRTYEMCFIHQSRLDRGVEQHRASADVGMARAA